jgi:hypothetical protein
MGAIDFFWHLCNLFAVSALFGALAAGGAKFFWRHALVGVAWHRLAAGVAASAMAVTVTGLLLFGRDGRMATYGLMVLAGALTLGWAGLRRRR